MFVERTCVGLDVHARSVKATGIDDRTGEVFRASLSADYGEVLGWLQRLPAPLEVAYEAGPTGFGLYRFLVENRVSCVVVAPSKLQRPSGDRVKTDARDALHLARLLRMGEVTAVTVPSVGQEAARDLVRAREDCRGDLMRARHRLSKLLLRHGLVYDQGQAWSQRHDRWLQQQRSVFAERPAHQLTFDAAYEAVAMISQRRKHLDTQIEAMAADSDYTPVVQRLGCLRGISTLTGFALAVEIGDWHRLSGSTIASYVGLVPSEHSSGTKRTQGPITKTGNTHARRLLVEAAWHHRSRYQAGGAVATRWRSAPPAAKARGDAGNRRLHARWASYIQRRKRPTIANVAIARELAGWCWSLATLDD